MNDLAFPRNLLEFDKVFPDEESARVFLMKARWPAGFVCPKCDGRGWRLKRRAVFECPAGHQTSITAGTVFHGTRKPLRLWFRVLFLTSAQKTGLSAKNLMRLLGLPSYQTAWHWLHKLRRAMVRPNRPKLEGRIEEDEAWIGGEATGTGRGCGLIQVIAAVEVRGKAAGRVRLRVIPDQTSKTLCGFTSENVSKGSTVATDGWQAYEKIVDLGYKHVCYVHKPKKLPKVHRVFGLLKRWLVGTHHGAVEEKHLQAYLEEFTFRFNRRHSANPGNLFMRLVEQAAVTNAVPYGALVGT